MSWVLFIQIVLLMLWAAMLIIGVINGVKK